MDPALTATKENEWLGFCPSAVRLQNGDKKAAFKKRTAYHDSFSAAGVTTLACATRGCVFSGQMSVDHVWKIVLPYEELGLKFRWAFLAKSHTQQARFPSRLFQFLCPICVYTQGHAEGYTWMGPEMFLTHISTHRGRDISPEVRSRLYIINDRQADDRDDFDLNLFPTAPAPGAASASGDASGGPAPPPGDGSPTTIGISPSTTSSSLSLHKTPTKSKIVDSLFTRKHSAAVTDHSHHHHHPHLPHLHHAATFPLVASPIGEAAPGADGPFSPAAAPPTSPSMTELHNAQRQAALQPWSNGLSEFKIFREEEYFTSDF